MPFCSAQKGGPDQPKRWRAFQRGLAHLNRRGEFALNGLRNRDLRACLFPSPADPAEQRRRTARQKRTETFSSHCRRTVAGERYPTM
jgi:hypothetical protein